VSRVTELLSGESASEGPAAGPGDRRTPSGSGPGLLLGSLGVVFGDIGTSPLYSMQTVFSIDGGAEHPTRVTCSALSRWSSGPSH
jgi:KUP system potassium uptake protein